jgi:hypothetical protein
LTNDEKIVREAAMAAGDAVPVGSVGASSAPKGVVRAGGGRRRVEAEPVVDEVVEEVVVDGDDVQAVELLVEAPEVEAQLSVEEEIERRTAQEHNDTPHFRKDAE